MLPRLQAEESFLAAERIAIGTGSASQPREITRRWKDALAPGTRQAAVKATPQALGQLGIGVRRVPRKSSAAAVQSSAQVIS